MCMWFGINPAVNFCHFPTLLTLSFFAGATSTSPKFDLSFLVSVFFLFYSTLYLSRLMTKPTKWHVRPAKTQISLGEWPIRPGWSESLLGAQSVCWFCHEAAHFAGVSTILIFGCWLVSTKTDKKMFWWILWLKMAFIPKRGCNVKTQLLLLWNKRNSK